MQFLQGGKVMSQNLLTQDHNNELKIIEFLIEEELPDGSSYVGHYGINVAKVVSIIREPSITSLPSQADPSVLGTFNLRGNVLPILDLASWMGKKMIPNPNNKVIVTEFCSVQSAFLVSNVVHILNGVEGIGFVTLDRSDIVRHKLVTRIVNAYEAHDKET